ncbi:MAG: MFS transporter [Deltaproteobacteria bacterium]|nr:MFS transporter [Deltaproteobacteria bacterium]
MAGSSYARLLGDNPGFRRLFVGEAISYAGDWFNLIALYAAVQSRTSSGLAVALVLVAKTLPAFVIAPFAGPLVDRSDRRRLLLLMDGLRLLCALGLVASHLADSLAGLYLCTIALVTCTGIAIPAKNAALPMLVEPMDIPAANALSGGTWSVMLALGAALGGVATAKLGITAALVLDAATFALSAIVFARLPALPAPGRHDGAESSLAAGLRYLRAHPYIAATAALKPLMQIGGGTLALVALYGTVVFSGTSGPMFVGLLYAARGTGALVGALLPRALFGDSPRALRRVIAGAFLLIAAAYGAVAAAPSYALAALGFFAGAIGSSTVWVSSSALLQLEADRSFHGRIFALEFGTMTLSLSISGVLAGGAVDLGFHPQTVTAVCAAATVIPALLWTAAIRRWAP